MQKFKNLFLTAIFLVSACSVTEITDFLPTPRVISETTVVTTLHHMDTPVHPIETRTQPSVTPSVTVTPVVTETQRLYNNCLKVLPETSLSNLSAQGWAVYKDTVNVEWISINLQTGEQNHFLPQLPDGEDLFASVHSQSPNKKYLAIEEMQWNDEGIVIDSHLWIINVKGEILADFDFENDLPLGIYRWVSDERMEILFKGENQTRYFSALSLNPFTGEVIDYSSPLPNAYNGYEQLIWTQSNNPNFDQVLYMSNGLEDEDFFGVVLWDRNEEKLLWEKSGFSYDFPAWSPSGDFVAVTVDSDFYVLAQTGQEVSLPFFDDNRSERSFSWSPDGSWLAFWSYDLLEDKSHLFLFDMTSNTIVDYCFTQQSRGRIPLWSPDSRQVIADIMIEGEDGSNEYVSILIDLEKEEAYQIPEDEHPLFWMSSAP